MPSDRSQPAPEQGGETTVTMSLKNPDLVCHLPTGRCAIQEPHQMQECNEFDHRSTPPAAGGAGGGVETDEARLREVFDRIACKPGCAGPCTCGAAELRVYVRRLRTRLADLERERDAEASHLAARMTELEAAAAESARLAAALRRVEEGVKDLPGCRIVDDPLHRTWVPRDTVLALFAARATSTGEPTP